MNPLTEQEIEGIAGWMNGSDSPEDMDAVATFLDRLFGTSPEFVNNKKQTIIKIKEWNVVRNEKPI